MKQPNLFDPIRFDGATYDEKRDKARLSGQLLRVQQVMADGKWRTLRDLSRAAGGTEASVSARLRDLRKPRFGALTVERRSMGGGLFVYRVVA